MALNLEPIINLGSQVLSFIPGLFKSGGVFTTQHDRDKEKALKIAQSGGYDTLNPYQKSLISDVYMSPSNSVILILILIFIFIFFWRRK